jgi:hypothetical protein
MLQRSKIIIDQKPEVLRIIYIHLSAASEPQCSRDPEISRANSLRCSARFLTKSPQPSCSRYEEIHHPDNSSLTVTTEAVSPLPGPTVEQQRARDKQKFRTKQPTRCIKHPKLYLVIKLYMFRESSVSIIRSYLLYTRQLVCFTQVMWPLPSRVRLEPVIYTTMRTQNVRWQAKCLM